MSRHPEHDPDEEHEFPKLHRDEELDHDGVEQVVIERFVHYRLHFLLKVKQEMDDGKTLTEGELELMIRMIPRAQRVSHLVYDHPELSVLAAKLIDLVHGITSEALENATGNSGSR
ncbi:hypothetical protein EY643_15030 [Halioglobus maricola]|uniref:Uncharacterized protein n=1 Tax=Halioglobus maricola TaxID=2601894 RepID=A0A5P9NM49_9GAMM|nr:hypothetical protein [Halioglobus maricola]QFU76857.1 hypothetical protein EY643_15030 [Halioglobus maricola]